MHGMVRRLAGVLLAAALLAATAAGASVASESPEEAVLRARAESVHNAIRAGDLKRAGESIADLERGDADAKSGAARVFARRVRAEYAEAVGDLDRAETLYVGAVALVRDGAVPAREAERDFVAAVGALVDFYLAKRRDLRPPQLFGKVTLAVGATALPREAEEILRTRANKLYSVLPRFEAEDSAPCVAGERKAAATRALLIANLNYQSDALVKLTGPVNDIKLLEKSLQARGAKHVRLVENATRGTMLSEMQRLVREVRCGDSVLFHYSGHALGAELKLVPFALPTGWADGILPVDLPSYSPEDGGAALLSSILWNAEISEFVTALRNRGANVFVALDAGAHTSEIMELQRRAASVSQWNFERPRFGGGKDWRIVAAENADGLTALVPGAGGFALFDAKPAGHYAGTEIPLKDASGETRVYGLLSYAIAQVLQTQARPNVREIAEGIARVLTSVQPDLGIGQIAASDPELVFLEPAKPLVAETLDIEILSPKLRLTRGALQVEEPTFELIGRVKRPGGIAHLTLNHRPLQFDGNGRFKAKIELVAGQNQVVFASFGFDHSFRTKTLEFTYDGDLNRFAAAGERYALVIGIRNYDHWARLETPHNDARAVAEVLRKDYGFKTELDLADGQKRPLLLLDATLRDITTALTVLRQRLTENDSLLIYYAGHGKLLHDNQVAYWVPKDGDRDDQFSWLSARQLTSELKRMNVRSVLVVSDSCFSGAMTRAAPDLSAYSEDRRRALLKAGAKRSRIFIASGGTEPVLDKGCRETAQHSVFACAFLQALREIQEPVFSSGELHHMHLLPRVSGRVQQQPERKELSDSGHDNGEFIFARVQAQAAGRAVEAAAQK